VHPGAYHTTGANRAHGDGPLEPLDAVNAEGWPSAAQTSPSNCLKSHPQGLTARVADAAAPPREGTS